jgi:hypothetical protein
MRNRKLLRKFAIVFAGLLVLAMLMFTLLPLILSGAIGN